jgi:hypothetical protein
MQFVYVIKAAYLKRLVQRMHNHEMRLDDFLRLRGGGRDAARGGFWRGTRQERDAEDKRRDERSRVSVIAVHRA